MTPLTIRGSSPSRVQISLVPFVFEFSIGSFVPAIRSSHPTLKPSVVGPVGGRCKGVVLVVVVYVLPSSPSLRSLLGL